MRHRPLQVPSSKAATASGRMTSANFLMPHRIAESIADHALGLRWWWTPDGYRGQRQGDVTDNAAQALGLTSTRWER